MSALVQEIQAVRALRKNIRNQPLTDAVMKAIEMIHQSIASSPENSSSSKKTEWRGQTSSSNQGFRGSATHQPSRGNFFGGARPSQGQQDGRRFRNSAPASKEVMSVPLENRPTYEPVMEKKDEDGFQTVHRTTRTNRRSDHGRSIHESSASSTPSVSDPPVVFRTAPPQKYVSRFRKDTDQVEDIILNKILRGKLNKFSPSNYGEIKEFITHIIDNGETEMIKCFMKLLFEKAASEEMFCPLYAKLLSELSSKYPILLDEMKNLYGQYMAIFEEIPASSEASVDGTYEDLIQRNIEKKYRRGYSQFLAELIKYNVIDREVFIKTVSTIIHQVELNLTNKESIKLVEEYADCLMKITKAIKIETAAVTQEDADTSDEEEKKSDNRMTEIRCVLKDDFMNRIQPLTVRQPEKVGLSNKARFTFLDVYEEIQRF